MEGEKSLLMKLRPYAAQKVWGGEFLKKQKNITSQSAVGETLEISTLAGQNSTYKNQHLSEITGELSYLVKLIETTDNLSVQVHPGNEYALQVENSKGKSECWLILDAQDGAGIYLGFRPGVSKEVFQTAIEKGEAVNELRNFYPVKRGDFFFVSAGAIHAIGAGVMLAEVQQNCGVTYRIWDWNRLGLNGKPRELHVKKAMDVTDFSEERNIKEYFQFKENVFDHGDVLLAKHEDFNFSILMEEKTISLQSARPNGFINFSTSPVKLINGNVEIELKYLESGIALTGSDELSISGKEIILGQVY